MIGLTNAGGGGGGLRVAVGMTAPANPRDGVVWVESATAGKKYVVSKTEPQNPATGLIWIALSGDSIITAKVYEYNGSSWASTSAYIYANGEWVQFSYNIVYLYNEGDKCVNLTGGWYTKAWALDGSTGAFGSEPTVEYGNKTAYMHMQVGGGDTDGGGGWFTNNPINLAGYKSIIFNVTSAQFNNSNYTLSNLGVYNTANRYFSGIATTGMSWENGATYTDKTFSVDVSKISSSYRVGVYFRCHGNYMGATFDKIYLQG